jgi:hypothetical protein
MTICVRGGAGATGQGFILFGNQTDTLPEPGGYILFTIGLVHCHPSVD